FDCVGELGRVTRRRVRGRRTHYPDWRKKWIRKTEGAIRGDLTARYQRIAFHIRAANRVHEHLDRAAGGCAGQRADAALDVAADERYDGGRRLVAITPRGVADALAAIACDGI